MINERRLIRAEPSFGLTTKLFQISWIYVLLICCLAGVGYAALYSAAGGSPDPYASKQAIRFAFGLVMMLCVALVDIRFIDRLAWPLYAVSLALLALVLRMGHVGKGAQRWIEVGGTQLQPSELMKIALVVALAAWFHRATWERMGNPLFLIPPALAVAAPVALILKEPNLGTAVITALVGGAIFLAAGVRWWKMALVVLPIPFAARIAYGYLHDYQRARIETFLNPESDPLGAGYNIQQSKIALGSGGMWGKGYPAGHAGPPELPAGEADRLHLHHAGGGVRVRRLPGDHGPAAADRARRHGDGAALPAPVRAPGGARHRVNFFLYVAVNIAMVTGAIPVGGVPLPLVSYGGSASLTVMLGFGILMSAYVHRDVEFKDRRED